MKITITFFSLILSLSIYAQVKISGKVTDTKNQPIYGANVYLDGTYDGATTNENGNFSFTSEEKGIQVLVISYLSYETKTITKDVTMFSQITVKLRDDVSTLDTVVLSAGTFEANDNSKVSVLKPLDVVTTASALGDFVGALQTLPGTSNNAEDGRLFVRGGNADESQIFIDGIRVFTPFTPTVGNLPTRGRYSPFLFDGITFSTGGYSAEYGQALSSVLLLNTVDEPDQEKTEIGILSVGASLGNTQKWEKSSLSVKANYINLAPYLSILEDRNEWKKPFETIQGEAVFRQKLNNGMLKYYAAFDATNLELTQEDINVSDGLQIKLKNNNFYTNASYKGVLGNSWSVVSGLSYTYGNTNTGIEATSIANTEHSAHAKLKFKKHFSNRYKLNFGVEQFLTDVNEEFSNENLGFNNNISAAFTEADVIFSKDLALKVGVRADYSSIFKSAEIAPRVTMAYKVAKNSQFSLAYGNFYQNPSGEALKFEKNLTPQKTTHYIFNYQYVNNDRIFRAELYRKDYDNLVKFESLSQGFNTNFTSTGDAYAQGLDLFWRDNKSIKNLDYWVSYSLLDTQRNNRDFPNAAQPSFASKHNFSIVGKYWIDSLKSQVGFDYIHASGRPYTDPNTNRFLGERTKSFNSASFNWAYLISQQKILYFSVNNVFNIRNINGYQYANTPSLNGNFDRRALRTNADQFFVLAFFWTISEKGTDNQLDNL